MSQEFSQTVDLPNGEARPRLDVWLSLHANDLSRTKAQDLIDSGCVSVNDVPSSTAKMLLKHGDRVVWSLSFKRETRLEPRAMDLEILYEDDDLIIVNKPAGVAVHPGAGSLGPTLVEGLLYHCKTLGRPKVYSPSLSLPQTEENETGDDEAIVGATETGLRPGVVHRLDKDTTGALVVAKTDSALAHLSRQFYERTNFRQYICLLSGKLPDGEWIKESYLRRDPSDRKRFTSVSLSTVAQEVDRTGNDLKGHKFAKTLFKKEVDCEGLSLASVKLFTGRTHQIRVHAKDLGCPIVGDQVYGSQAPKKPISVSDDFWDLLKGLDRQMLHAWVIGFEHPRTKAWLQVEAPFPKDFADVVAYIKRVNVEK
jgi:23S rRNA pseudouridine1911/1915/1917 synthase